MGGTPCTTCEGGILVKKDYLFLGTAFERELLARVDCFCGGTAFIGKCLRGRRLFAWEDSSGRVIAAPDV